MKLPGSLIASFRDFTPLQLSQKIVTESIVPKNRHGLHCPTIVMVSKIRTTPHSHAPKRTPPYLNEFFYVDEVPYCVSCSRSKTQTHHRRHCPQVIRTLQTKAFAHHPLTISPSPDIMFLPTPRTAPNYGQLQLHTDYRHTDNATQARATHSDQHTRSLLLVRGSRTISLLLVRGSRKIGRAHV